MTIDIAAQHQRINAANDGKWFALDFERYLAGLYLWLLRPGMIAVDCGANIGTHTLQMARAVDPGGLVVTIEPIGDLLTRLRFSMEEQGLPQALVRTVQSAVSDRTGSARFFHVDDPVQHGLSGLRKRHYGADVAVKPVIVELTTLDAICAGLPRLDFLKLDIEGGEFDALCGAAKTLRRFRPIMTLEQAQSDPHYFGYTWGDLLACLGGMEYGLYDFFGLEYTRDNQLEGCMVWDFVAVPREYPNPGAVFTALRNCMIASGVKGLDGAAMDGTRQVSTEGCLVRRLGQSVEDQKVYFIENGTKRWVANAAWIAAKGMRWPADVRVIPAEELDSLPTGPPLS